MKKRMKNSNEMRIKCKLNNKIINKTKQDKSIWKNSTKLHTKVD